MPDGTFDTLSVTGARVDLVGEDTAGNHWIRIGGGAEPDSCALGFNVSAKVVFINGPWTAQLGGPVHALQDVAVDGRIRGHHIEGLERRIADLETRLGIEPVPEPGPYEHLDCDQLQHEILRLQEEMQGPRFPTGVEKVRLVSAIKQAEAERDRKGC